MTPKIMSSTSQAAPDGHEDQERDDDGDGEEVLEEADDRGLPDQRDVEIALEETAEGLDDGEEEDGESPEGEGVSQAGDRPLEEFLLTADLDQFGLDPLGHLPEPGGHGRLAGRDQLVEPEETATGDGEHHRGDAES